MISINRETENIDHIGFITIQQGRIHGLQLRTGGQGRICAFYHFSTRADGRTDGPTDNASYRVASPRLKSKTAPSIHRISYFEPSTTYEQIIFKR